MWNNYEVEKWPKDFSIHVSFDIFHILGVKVCSMHFLKTTYIAYITYMKTHRRLGQAK
jgi:hypothetical protein